MKLFLLILGVTLAVCEDTSSSVHWDKSTSSQYAFVNGKPVGIPKDPIKIVKDAQGNDASTTNIPNQKIEKSNDPNDPAKFRYPGYYPGNYPYPDPIPYTRYPFRYPELDPGFGRPDLWNPRTVVPYDYRNEDKNFRLREE